MSKTVEIPGGTATLRDPSEVRQRDRRRLETASIMAQPAMRKFPDDADPRELDVSSLGLTRDEFDALYQLQDATILATLEAWTLDRPLPTSEAQLGELPAGLYDALRTATAPAGADTLAPVDFTESPDPERPTGDDSGSGGSSKAAPASKSTKKSRSAGASTATESSTPE